MTAIPAAYVGKYCFFVCAIYTPRPRAAFNIVYTRTIFTVTPRLYFFTVIYATLTMGAKFPRRRYFTA